MTNKQPIGFFDSGVGGLSVLARFKEILPLEDTIYFGDLKNLPYGNKSQDELISFARKILDFFESKDVKAVAIACNTSSALAYEAVKNDYSFRLYPIIQSCSKVISDMNLKRVGVFATQGTVNSNAYKRELQKYSQEILVKEIACPNWVNIVEGVSNVDIDSDIKEHIDEMLEFAPEKIILGCTHYPYLLKKLGSFLPEKLFIDPAEIFVDYIKKDLQKAGMLESSGSSSEAFYVSANPEAFMENAKLFYNIKNNPLVV